MWVEENWSCNFIAFNLVETEQMLIALNNKNSLTYFSLGLCVFIAIRPVWYAITREFQSSPLDEILIIYLMPAAFLGMFVSRKNSAVFYSALLISLYIVIFSISGIVNDNTSTRGGAYVYGMLMEMKWVFFILAAYYFASQIGGREQFLRPIWIVLVTVALVNSAPAILDFLSNGTSTFGLPLNRRGPFWQPNGIFHHPVSSAHATVFGYIAALCIVPTKHRNALYAVRALLFGIIIMHGVAKEFIAAIIVTLLYIMTAVSDGRKRYMAVTAIAIVASLFLAYFSEVFIDRALLYISDEGDTTVRRLLYSASFSVANDFFPLGAGPSSFASEGARTGIFSPLYATYGVYGVWGANYENSEFLTDVFWPKILGESGFIGTIFYAAFISIPFFRLMPNLGRLSNIGRFSLFIYTSGLISSIASPALNSELYAVMFYTSYAVSLFRINILSRPTERSPHSEPLIAVTSRYATA